MLFNIVNMVSWNRRYTMTKILSNMLNLKGDFKPKKKKPKTVNDIYDEIMSLNLDQFVLQCHKYKIRYKFNTMYGIDGVIDDLLREKCYENNIPLEKNDDLYFGVELNTGNGLWIDE